MKTYRHSLIVHLIAPFLIGLMGLIIFQLATDDGEFKGGDVAKLGFMIFCGIFMALVAVLYLQTGFTRFYLTEDGIMVKKPWRTNVYPWSELEMPRLNTYLKYVTVRDRMNRIVVFSSIDLFPKVGEFLDTIQLNIASRQGGEQVAAGNVR